ncbi:MAG: DUF4411 family protein [Flavobacteriaceae bacterium]|nr:DUF4411 family protein [Flavobacteriaceae bacterium]
MSSKLFYLLDSDVLITAKNSYYGFDLCPGFWKSLQYHHNEGNIFSIDKVFQELTRGKKEDNLIKWSKNNLPQDFFKSSDSNEVVNNYRTIINWVENRDFKDNAKKRFASGADGWLIAYAKTHNATLVTNEKSEPKSKKKVKIPDVCENFDVSYRTVFYMLDALKVQFKLN